MLKRLTLVAALLSSTSYAAADTIYTYAIYGSVVQADFGQPHGYGMATGTVTVDSTTQTWLNVDFSFPGLGWHFSTPPTEYYSIYESAGVSVQMNFIGDASTGGWLAALDVGGRNAGKYIPAVIDPVTGEIIEYGHYVPVDPFFLGLPGVTFRGSTDPTIRSGAFGLISTYETPAPVVGAGLPGFVLAAFWWGSRTRKRYRARLPNQPASSVTVRSAG
jgi:hypothetical protein